MSQPNTLTWVRGEKKYGAEKINYGSDNPDWYQNRICHGCGDKFSAKSCKVSYYVGAPENEESYQKYDWIPQVQRHCGASENTYNVYCLDYTICPNLANIQAQPQWGNYDQFPHNADRPNSGDRTAVDCLYPLSMFTDEETVENYKDEFDEFGITNEYNNVILPFFCASQNINNPRAGRACPKDPLKGDLVNMEACSNMVSSRLCKDWLNNTRSTPALSDNAKQKYCDNFNTPDCLCINRNENPLYISIAPAVPTTPACWWLPCKDFPFTPKQYLVPSGTTCEDSGCNSVVLVLGQSSSGLTINTNQLISCDTNNGLSPNGSESKSKVNTIWSNYWWIILIITLIIVLIIIVLIVVL